MHAIIHVTGTYTRGNTHTIKLAYTNSYPITFNVTYKQPINTSITIINPSLTLSTV